MVWAVFDVTPGAGQGFKWAVTYLGYPYLTIISLVSLDAKWRF